MTQQVIIKSHQEQSELMEITQNEGGESVYYSFWEQGCDLCESSYTREFEDEAKAQEYIDSFNKESVGACSVTKITKGEHVTANPFTLDYSDK